MTKFAPNFCFDRKRKFHNKFDQMVRLFRGSFISKSGSNSGCPIETYLTFSTVQGHKKLRELFLKGMEVCKNQYSSLQMVIKGEYEDIKISSCDTTGGAWGRLAPNPESWQKLSKKFGIKLVAYTFRLTNYIKIPPTSFRFFRTGAATANIYKIPAKSLLPCGVEKHNFEKNKILENQFTQRSYF